LLYLSVACRNQSYPDTKEANLSRLAVKLDRPHQKIQPIKIELSLRHEHKLAHHRACRFNPVYLEQFPDRVCRLLPQSTGKDRLCGQYAASFRTMRREVASQNAATRGECVETMVCVESDWRRERTRR